MTTKRQDLAELKLGMNELENALSNVFGLLNQYRERYSDKFNNREVEFLEDIRISLGSATTSIDFADKYVQTLLEKEPLSESEMKLLEAIGHADV